MNIQVTSLFACAIALSLSACGDDSSGDDGSNGSTTGSPVTSDTGDDAETDTPLTTGGSSSTGPGEATDTTSGDSTDGDTTAADESSGDSTGDDGIAIAGVYEEDFGAGEVAVHTITDETWLQESSFGDTLYHLDSWDNDARWAVAQGDETNDFAPGLYAKFTWLWESETLYYCTAVFDAASAEDAEAAPGGDESDLETGCSGFPWSRLDAQ